jgi:hypothetical protein
VISKATAAINFSQLQQPFTGNSKQVVVSTTPAGLAVQVTYNNAASAPINAGDYQVMAVIIDANYEGTATAGMVVSKAAQTLIMDAIEDKTFGDAALTLTARTNSLLPVSYSVVKGPAVIVNNVLNLTGAGQVVIRATQAGNENFQEASAVERTICVRPAKPVITSSSATEKGWFMLTSSSKEGNEWLLNGEPITGATGQTYQVTKPGTYAVRVVAETCTKSLTK